MRGCDSPPMLLFLVLSPYTCMSLPVLQTSFFLIRKGFAFSLCNVYQVSKASLLEIILPFPDTKGKTLLTGPPSIPVLNSLDHVTSARAVKG